MDFDLLIQAITDAQNKLQKRALQSVNQYLVIRNWLIGFYIVEFEQHGEDRAKYGEKLLIQLATALKKKRGMSYQNLNLFRQFYFTYPQLIFPVADSLQYFSISNLYINELVNTKILQPVAGESEKRILQPVAGESSAQKGQPEAVQFQTDPKKLLQHFSFRHFTELIKIKEPLKRLFYEQQAIKGDWSSRQLARQIETLLIERVGLSKDKDKMLQDIMEQNDIERIEDTLNDPYFFEFSGLKELPEYSEHDLETALINKIEDFLLELGNGFCFEARQKRITVSDEHDRIDLVFYHRILRCHVLIDLKNTAFRKDYVGQMIYYLNYYRENMMTQYDNPPVGIILCTEKDHAKVHYATAGLDQSIFVAKYMVELPKEEELLRIIKNEK